MLVLHHLNCGTIGRPTEPDRPSDDGPLGWAQGVMHVILAETDAGLLLLDCGIGTQDIQSPSWFIRAMLRAGRGSPAI